MLWLMAAYTALLVSFAWRHVFWGDEAQAWLLARDSPSLGALWRNVRYEGTPPVWHLLLWFITRFTHNPEWMKAPQVLFSLAGAALVLTARQLPLWVRAGVVFSYFFAFEYSVINRHYMLGIMLLLGALRYMEHRRGWAATALLAVAMLTSLPALIVAACLYGWSLARERRVYWQGVAVLAVVAAVAVAYIRPPADSFNEMKPLGLRVVAVFPYITDAFVPVPRWTMPFWNRPMLMAAPLLRGLGGMALVLPLVWFFRERSVRLFFLAACALLLAELLVTSYANERQVGWLFVAFVLALMLEGRVQGRHAALMAMLAVQVVAGAYALVRCAEYPFSANRQAAEFLRGAGLERAPLVMPEAEGTPLLAYLDRTGYFPGRGPGRSYVMWDRAFVAPKNEMVKRADVEAAGSGAVVVVEEKLSATQRQALGVQELAAFDGPTCQGETLFLYR